VVSERQTVTVDPAREAAFRSLRRVTEKDAYVNIVVDSTLERHDWPERDRRLYTTLVYGTLRNRGLIDWVLARRVGKKFPGGIHPPILTILRMGVYQILFLDRTPKYASVDESVKLARKHGHRGTAALVNAVLRATPRDAGAVELPDKAADPAMYVATKYSHPLWLVQRWLDAWGLNRTESVCASNNDMAPLTVRANTLRVSHEELRQRLSGERAAVRKNTEVPEELEIVRSPGSVKALGSFREGLFYVQDASSICASHVLGPEPGETVVDLCAGPGGKTTHLAQLMQNRGRIYAVDIKRHRVSLTRDNCRMLGVTIVRCLEGDARQISELNLPPADRVLLDAPCSGTGTFRRRVDLKWRLCSEDVERLVHVQKELLAAAASIVKPGGVLVFSLCSVDQAETDEAMTADLLRSAKLAVDDSCPPWMLRFRTAEGRFRIMPGDMGMDGFFMAKYKKAS
jgi:16S rRNA (cytosine967-C5)-methyltransferase